MNILDLIGDEPWRDEAGCRDRDTNDWYAEQGSAEGLPIGMERALYICWNKCPVREECLRVAVNRPERDGIWGGALAVDRHRRGYRNTYEVVNRRARRAAEDLGIVRKEGRSA